jgi:hypothetical protein
LAFIMEKRERAATRQARVTHPMQLEAQGAVVDLAALLTTVFPTTHAALALYPELAKDHRAAMGALATV